MPLLRAPTSAPARASSRIRTSSTSPFQHVCAYLPEIAAAEQSGLVVVRAEVGGARVGDVDGDQRNARLEVLRRDGRRHRLVGLELDDEIDLLLDQVLRVPQRHFRLIPVVDDDELEVLAFCGAKQARMHLAGKRAVLPLRRRSRCGTVSAAASRPSGDSGCSSTFSRNPQ